MQVEGIRDLNRALRAVGGREGQKELGQVHKGIGGMVIRAAGGASSGVGEGAGSTIRASAATGSVQLRVGGAHRDNRRRQWGKRQVFPGDAAPFRPNLIGTAVSIQGRIEDAYLAGVDRIIRRVGLA